MGHGTGRYAGVVQQSIQMQGGETNDRALLNALPALGRRLVPFLAGWLRRPPPIEDSFQRQPGLRMDDRNMLVRVR